MSKQTKKRILVLLVCVALILVYSLSLSFIIEYTQHDCTGHDCPICTQIHAAHNILKQIVTVIVYLVLLCAGMFLLLPLLQNNAIYTILSTLFCFKVRMNN